MNEPIFSVLTGKGDPLWSSVILLLPLDGTDQTIVDVSSSPKSVTLYQQDYTDRAVQQSGVAKFGSAVRLSEVLQNYYVRNRISVSGPANAFEFTGQFTIEMWYRTESISGYADATFFQQSDLSGENYNISIRHVGATIYIETDGYTRITANNAIAAATWHHIAVCRDAANVLRLYVDGIQIGSATVAGTFHGNNEEVRIGASSFTSMVRYIDDVRITLACRYPDGTTFTPPAAAFPTS